jgi:alpha-glucosidase (family GH31 glycosyl hydrolase)
MDVKGNDGKYASVPYVTAHSTQGDASLLWVNSADTWVDVLPSVVNGTYCNFVSESGLFELFMFASPSPKAQLYTLATITGFAPLPHI